MYSGSLPASFPGSAIAFTLYVINTEGRLGMRLDQYSTNTAAVMKGNEQYLLVFAHKFELIITNRGILVSCLTRQDRKGKEEIA